MCTAMSCEMVVLASCNLSVDMLPCIVESAAVFRFVSHARHRMQQQWCQSLHTCARCVTLYECKRMRSAKSTPILLLLSPTGWPNLDEIHSCDFVLFSCGFQVVCLDVQQFWQHFACAPPRLDLVSTCAGPFVCVES